MDNLEIYNTYRNPPENALKAFDNGKFKGTDINTMWRIKSLTEAFGICGIGWYFTPKKLWIENTSNGEQFAFAEIELFIKVDGEWSMPISGNGGNKLTRVTKDGKISTSDEAFKMAITDALGVACRNLGFGADIYWENDQTKYTQSKDDSQDINDKTIHYATPNQVAFLEKIYQGEHLTRLLASNNIQRLQDLTIEKASELIGKIKKNQNKGE